MYFEQACAVYSIVRPSVGRELRKEDVARGKKIILRKFVLFNSLIVRPSVGRGIRLKDLFRSKKMYFEQTCDVYLIVRPSVGRGLRLEDVSRGNKMYFVASLCCLLNCKAFGGSRVKTRRYISRQEDVF